MSYQNVQKKKTLEWISKLSYFTGYKMNIQKWVVFPTVAINRK
jgi:hypothetical protein